MRSLGLSVDCGTEETGLCNLLMGLDMRGAPTRNTIADHEACSDDYHSASRPSDKNAAPYKVRHECSLHVWPLYTSLVLRAFCDIYCEGSIRHCLAQDPDAIYASPS